MPRMLKLLVVDDSALMRRVLRDIFMAEGDFEVRVAGDGAEGLAAVGEFAPDVVTLDITMPGMDGLACLERIMIEAPRPVVMLSALTRAGAEATLEALRLGAVDFVAKPDGAVSLGVEGMRDRLVEIVRAAAAARVPHSFRLAERVRHRLGQALVQAPPSGIPSPAVRLPSRTSRRPAARVAAPPPGAAAGHLVLLGASTGGPAAIEAVLTALPGDFPWPIVIAQHMPASFTGPFARRLDAACALRVIEVAGGPVPPRPGCAYVARGDADLILGRRPAGPVLLSAPASPEHPWHPSVDRLVASALGQFSPSRLLGVLLTGMGRDGAEAMAELHARGGRTIAQDEASSVVWGMPGELVQREGAEIVVPLAEIAGMMLRMVT